MNTGRHKVVVKQIVGALLLLASVGGLGFFATRTARNAITNTAEELTRAQDTRFYGSDVARLMYVQDDATKSMLIDPSLIGDIGEQKVKAYDSQTESLAKLESLSGDEETKRLVAGIREIDDSKLKKLDESLLEMLLGDEQVKAKETYFQSYLPERKKYAALVHDLMAASSKRALAAESSLQRHTEETVRLIGGSFAAVALLLAAVSALNAKRQLDAQAKNELAALLALTRDLSVCTNVPGVEEALRRHLVPERVRMAPSRIAIRGASDALGGGDSSALELEGLDEAKFDAGLRDFYAGVRLSTGLALRSVSDREAIARREHEMSLVLECMTDGLADVSLDGSIGELTSKPLRDWLALPREGGSEKKSGGVKIWDALYPEDGRARENFCFLFQQTALDILPFDVNATQLPAFRHKDGRVQALAYSQIFDASGAFHSVLVTLKDVTEEQAAKEREKQSREIFSLLEEARRNPAATHTFLTEMDGLIASLETTADSSTLKRTLHTIKGSGATMGLGTLAANCHETESRLIETGKLDSAAREAIRAQWTEFRARLANFLPNEAHEAGVPVSAIVDLMARSQDLLPDSAVTHELRYLTWTSVADRLTTLKRAAEQVATRLDKPVRVVIDSDVLLPPGTAEALFTSAVHVVRNAIDHGLESRATRVSSGKPEEGRLTIRAGVQGGVLEFSVSDDGGGVAWERVRAKALGLKLAAATEDDLVDALFSEDFSTRDVADDVSGRGVGLSAVRTACLEAGGTVRIRSEAGRGTSFDFRIPLAVEVGTTLEIIQRRRADEALRNNETKYPRAS